MARDRREPQRAVHLLDVLDQSAGPAFSVGLVQQFVQQIFEAALAAGKAEWKDIVRRFANRHWEWGDQRYRRYLEEQS